MLNKSEKLPCGKLIKKDNEFDVVCTCVGCKNCKFFDGTEYVKENIKKALGNWVKGMKLC
jgi:hypothetical protein